MKHTAINRKSIAVLGSISLLIMACGGQKQKAEKSMNDIFVPVYGVNQIVRVNPETYEIVDTIKVGERPHDLVLSPDRKLLYTDQKAMMDNNTVIIVDMKTGKRIGEIPVGNISHHLAINKNGSRLYVATNDLVVVDTKSREVLATFDMNRAVCVSAVNEMVFANDFNARSIYRLDPVHNVITDTLTLENHPLHNALSPDGKRLYVTVWSSEPDGSGLAVFDTETNAQLGFVKLGTDAADLDVSADGLALFATNTNKGIVYRINPQSFQIEWQVKIPAARSITVGAKGQKIFVGPMGHNTLYVLATSNGELLKKIEMEGQPNHVWVMK